MFLGYYPQNVPAIKFDHPLADNSDTLARYPIQPTPDLIQTDYQQYSVQKPDQYYPQLNQNQDLNQYQNQYPQQNQYPAGPVSEDGFIPLFNPNKADPVLENKNYQEQKQTSFKLPAEGYQLPFYLPEGQLPSNYQKLPNDYQAASSVNQQYPLVYRRPPQQLPESEFPIVYANNHHKQQLAPLPVSEPPTSGSGQVKPEQEVGQAEKIEDFEQIKTTSYPAVPPTEYHQKTPKNYPVFPIPSTSSSTELPYQRPTKTIPNNLNFKNEISTEESPIEENQDYYYVYENLPNNYPAPDEVINDFLNNLGVDNQQISEQIDQTTFQRETHTPVTETTEMTTTERKVPTLQVEEILPGPKFEKTSTTLTPPEGDAVYEYEYYYEYYEDPNYKNDSDLNVAQSLSNSETIIQNSVVSTIRPKIEEFQNIERFQEIQQTTKQPEQFSIQNFLNLLTNQENTSTNSRSDQTSTTEVTISTAGTSGAIHPKKHLLPAIGEITKVYTKY